MQTNKPSTLQTVQLLELEPGNCCTVTEIGTEAQSSRLQSMGICLGRTLEVLKSGDPLIVKVYGTRIGLSARLAEGIRVEACQGSQRCWEKMIPHG